jgi:hypothetical protein
MRSVGAGSDAVVRGAEARADERRSDEWRASHVAAAPIVPTLATAIQVRTVRNSLLLRTMAAETSAGKKREPVRKGGGGLWVHIQTGGL